MPKTLGQEEDDKAFKRAWANSHRRWGWWYIGSRGVQGEHDNREERFMRYAFGAGMKRGEEKRGCCEDKDAEQTPHPN